jgi:hypothetical protein
MISAIWYSCRYAVVRLGPDHFEIRVQDFGSITLVPPSVAENLYGDKGLGQGVSSMDAAVREIEGVLAEVRRSGIEVSPILERSRTGGGGSGSPTSSTPHADRRGTTRPRAMVEEGAPDTKKQR